MRTLKITWGKTQKTILLYWNIKNNVYFTKLNGMYTALKWQFHEGKNKSVSLYCTMHFLNRNNMSVKKAIFGGGKSD